MAWGSGRKWRFGNFGREARDVLGMGFGAKMLAADRGAGVVADSRGAGWRVSLAGDGAGFRGGLCRGTSGRAGVREIGGGSGRAAAVVAGLGGIGMFLSEVVSELVSWQRCADCGGDFPEWDDTAAGRAGLEWVEPDSNGVFTGDGVYQCWECWVRVRQAGAWAAREAAREAWAAAHCPYCGALIRPGRPHCKKGRRRSARG